jgi:hypothetical protein
MEKKVWSSPEMWELNIQNTEYGGANPQNIDGPYIEVDGQKYWPSAS